MAEPVALAGEAREVALAEAQAVLALVRDGDRRERLKGLVTAAGEGEVAGEDAEALEELLELGLQTGRIRALYGPGGEQAALRAWRLLPGGRAAAASARDVTAALGTLIGAELETASVQTVGPGAFTLTLAGGGRELTIRLGREGARVAGVSA